MDGHTEGGGNVRRHSFNGITWIDVDAPGQAVLTRLEQEYDLHPVHIHETVRKVQYNEVEHERNYLFLVMHYPMQRSETGKITVGQLGVFLGKDYVITVHAKE